MSAEYHDNQIDPHLVETWVKGWSLARGISSPVRDGGAFRVDVGWPKQLSRYVFPSFTDEFQQLADTIFDPWIHLKVCASLEQVGAKLPARWIAMPPGFMMVCYGPMETIGAQLPKGYTLELLGDVYVPKVRICTEKGEAVANGGIALVDDFAIYDCIQTHPEHQRKGLGAIVMKTLEGIALSRGITKGILVATAEGKLLYGKLGWQLYSDYTTIVIPDHIESI